MSGLLPGTQEIPGSHQIQEITDMYDEPTAVIPTYPVSPGAPAPAPKRSNRAAIVAAVVAAGLLIGGVGVALAWPSSPRTSDVAASVTAPLAAEEAAAQDSVADEAPVAEPVGPEGSASSESPAPPQSPAGSSTPSGGGSSSSSGGGKSAPAPSIKSFSTPENIDCHNGNLQYFTATWSTANATKVTISIDGSGIYDTYGPSGEASLPFNCSSSHTYVLKAYNGDGKSVSKSVTLKPRNAQAAEPKGSADED